MTMDMSITIYQIILGTVSLIVIGNRLFRFVRRETSQSVFKLVTVVGIWGVIGSVAFYPEIAHIIRRTLGFGDNFNTLIFIGFVILFVLFFKLLSIVEKLENHLTELIRKEALTDLKKRR